MGGARERPGRRGSWLVLLNPHQTRSQATGSCHDLLTCSCPGVLLQINKRSSADKLSDVYPQGLLLPEPATPAAAQGVLQGAGLALRASLSPYRAAPLPPRGGSPLEISGGVKILGVQVLAEAWSPTRPSCELCGLALVSASALGFSQRPLHPLRVHPWVLCSTYCPASERFKWSGSLASEFFCPVLGGAHWTGCEMELVGPHHLSSSSGC